MKRVDGNQSKVVEALRSIGAGWIYTSDDSRSGIDGIILWRGRAIPCEIKNGDLKPSAQRLTENELRTLRECARVGAPHVILTSPQNAIETILSFGT